MGSEPASTPETITARIALTIAGNRLEAEITVPTAPTRLTELVPLFHSLSDAVIGSVVKTVEASGRTISCRAGCAACCRQLVPITEPEARRVRDLVEDLPEPRRSAIKARFEAARQRLDEAGLLDVLRNLDRLSAEQRRSLGLEYFALKLACPFLEAESCSIHPERPGVCREFLVTSPAEHCASLTDDALVGVKMPAPIWPITALMNKVSPDPEVFNWVPLVLAPEWADTHDDESAPRPAPEWVQEFFRRLSGASIPAPAPGLMGSAGRAE